MWTLRLSPQAFKFIAMLQKKNRSQVEAGLNSLVLDPYSGKPLKGELKGYWSLRVGQYRTIYLIKKNEIIVEVLRIHHRKEVYEKMRRL